MSQSDSGINPFDYFWKKNSPKKQAFLTRNYSPQVLLLTVSWTLSLSLSCMSSPTLKPSSSPALPFLQSTLPTRHQSLPILPTSLQNPRQRHRLRLEDVRHRLSAAALQKVERETNRLRKNRRKGKFAKKVPAISCMMSTRSLVEKKGRCKPGGLCRVASSFFYDQVRIAYNSYLHNISHLFLKASCLKHSYRKLSFSFWQHQSSII